jgi:hypothetical protein
MLEANSKIKSDNFYFVDDLNYWNYFFRDFFTSFEQIAEEITNSNENYIDIDQTIDISSFVDELHE